MFKMQVIRRNHSNNLLENGFNILWLLIISTNSHFAFIISRGTYKHTQQQTTTAAHLHAHRCTHIGTHAYIYVVSHSHKHLLILGKIIYLKQIVKWS